MKSENLSKHCAKSRTLNNEINQKLSHFIQRWQRADVVGKASFVRSMEIKRDEVYSLILQEMSTMDNFISRKIKVVYHRNCYRKYTSKQIGCNCMYFKIFLECFILTNETKIPLNGFVLGACYNTCLWHSWNLFSTHPVSVWTSWWSAHWVKMMIRLVSVLNCDDFVLKGVYHNGCMTKYLLKSSPKNEQKQD
jgi:hypothetical protein